MPIYTLSDFARELLCREADPLNGIEDIGGCQYIASLLFGLVERRHGRGWACRIFLTLGSPPGARRLRKFKNWALLDRLDLMKPTPNIQRLARELAEENRILPHNDRWGPTGTTDWVQLDQQIRRACRDRSKHEKRGDWWGPSRVT
jgi:hypothetical protein